MTRNAKKSKKQRKLKYDTNEIQEGTKNRKSKKENGLEEKPLKRKNKNLKKAKLITKIKQIANVKKIKKELIKEANNSNKIKNAQKETKESAIQQSVVQNVQKYAKKRKNVEPSTENNAAAEVPDKKHKHDTDETPSKQPEEKQIVKWNDLEIQERTLFVGNIPVNTKRKSLKKYFSKYGEIQTIRIRNVVSEDPKIPKKIAYITNKIHPNIKCLQSYIVFSSKDEVTKALEENGKEFSGHHLRVDRATPNTEHNLKNAIFIGNLPFDVQDDAIWEAFQECGNIESVRLIRDKDTGVGKGFGYVNFDSSDAVELALQLEDVKVGKRIVRIKRTSSAEKLSKKRTADGKKLRKLPRVKKEISKSESEDQESKKKISNKTEFRGSKFTTKKKVKKSNKTDIKKKKLIKLLTQK